ncbi:MAG: carboxymuconolactone decarboxylase family protein [Actinomycetota bacterium]|nr:carboxymuconolactone decarboxylase family protein [Actinomycetota bacterium]
MTSRLAPVEQWPDGLLAAAEEVAGGPVRPDGNVYRTLANSPRLFLAWLGWGGHLLRRSTLDARLRELVILRATALSEGRYPFTQHVRIGRAVGLADADLEAVVGQATHRNWTDGEQAMLLAVDSLHARGGLNEAAWAALCDHFDIPQVLDIIATTAFYRMASWTLNACGTPFDEGQQSVPFLPPQPTDPGSVLPSGLRIEPVPVERWPDDLLASTRTWPRFADAPERRSAGVYCTLANHPALFESIGPMMAHLLVDNSLSDRHREIAIVRSCLLDGGDYPYRQHVRIAKTAGVDETTLAALAERNGVPADEADAAVVTVIDELHRTNRLTDHTWASGEQHLGLAGLLDTIATAGFYGLVSFALSTAGTPLEPGSGELPDWVR